MGKPKLIDEAEITPQEDAAIRGCLCAGFHHDAADFLQSRHWHGSAPEYSLVFDDEAMVWGHVGVVMRTVSVGERHVRIAGIQNLAVRPSRRSKGAGKVLMRLSMEEAVRRNAAYGMLFCICELEPYYGSLGWYRCSAQVTMDYDGRSHIPIPGKNICMVKDLASTPFPDGAIHLNGADW